MIDTDKYEGHTPAPWMNLGSDANSLLMQDAPLLLAEVKRLRKYAELVAVIEVIYENNNSYELTWDEFNGMLKEMIE